MAEQITNKYVRLLEIRILHHYWLDEGATVFDTLDAAAKTKRLLNYDLGSFMTIAPMAATVKTLKSLRAVFKETALGAVVAIPAVPTVPPGMTALEKAEFDSTRLSINTKFDFGLTVTNADFYRYTEFTQQQKKHKRRVEQYQQLESGNLLQLNTEETGPEIPDDVSRSAFALIHLAATTGVFGFTNADGTAKSPHPVYEIRFEKK